MESLGDVATRSLLQVSTQELFLSILGEPKTFQLVLIRLFAQRIVSEFPSGTKRGGKTS